MTIMLFLQFYAVLKEFILVTSGGDFVETKSPSVDEIVAATEPQTLTLLLSPVDSPDSSLSIATLREAAARHQLECKHCMLYSTEGWKDLLDNIPAMAAENCWVILENCHLLANCHEVLTAVMKVTVVFLCICVYTKEDWNYPCILEITCLPGNW